MVTKSLGICGTVLLTIGLSACEGPPGEAGPQGQRGIQGEPGPAGIQGPAGTDGRDGLHHTMVFRGIAEPLTDEQKRTFQASTQVTINGQDKAINYHPLVRTGDRHGGEIFGLIKGKDGLPLKNSDGSDYICREGSGPDHTSMLRYDDQLFAITHFECKTGGAYVMKLNQAADSGVLDVEAIKPVDFSGVYGTYIGCAGVTTSWNSHLGSEEYELPMASMENGQFPLASDNQLLKQIAAYNQIELDQQTAKHIGYYHGWIPEITLLNASGDTAVVKHYTMGRFAHELAYVMPDNKTVYLSDDGTRTGLFMFVADTPEDLSAGRLYAAKWIQESADGAGRASINWIDLGHATNAEIAAKLEDMDYTFDSMWRTAEARMDGTCPDDYSSVNSGDEGRLCLQLKQGQEMYASRLETRLYAAYLGATTEFNKEEGITYDPDHKRLYIAMSRIEFGMEDFAGAGIKNDAYDQGGNNDIRLDHNMCGAVYSLDVMEGMRDTHGKRIYSDFVVGNMVGELEGSVVDYSGTPYEKNACNINAIAMPDNLSYLPKYGILLIGEDTKMNQMDKIWAYDVRSQRLTRIFSGIYGAEITSPYWHANINGHGYITAVIQHPYGESDQGQARKAQDRESIVGYIGPFPALGD